MFDANILYYAYDNLDGDDFGVGYLSNKEAWIERVNSWGRNNGTRSDFTIDDFEELDATDLQGVLLAEVEPIDSDHLVTWVVGEDEFSVQIDKKGDIIWKNNSTKTTSVPRWLSRLKRTLKEYKV